MALNVKKEGDDGGGRKADHGGSRILGVLTFAFPRRRGSPNRDVMTAERANQKVDEINSNVERLRDVHPKLVEDLIGSVIQVEGLRVSLAITNTLLTLSQNGYQDPDSKKEALSGALSTILKYKASPDAMRIVSRIISKNGTAVLGALSDENSVRRIITGVDEVMKSEGRESYAKDDISWNAFRRTKAVVDEWQARKAMDSLLSSHQRDRDGI